MEVFMSLISQKFPRCVNVHWYFHVASWENVTKVALQMAQTKTRVKTFTLHFWHQILHTRDRSLIGVPWTYNNFNHLQVKTLCRLHTWTYLALPREQVPSAIFKSKLCTSYITLNYHKILHLYDHHDGQPLVHGKAAAKPQTSICQEGHRDTKHTPSLHTQMFCCSSFF